MIIHPEFAGIDISKKYLDVFDGAVAKPERFDNTPETAKLLAKRFKKNRTCSLFEATGRYDRFLREAFSAAGLCFVRVNPARARDFARATGTLVKTDAIDARMLAAMAQTLSPGVFVPVAPNRQKLVDLQLRRDQLVAMRAEENTRLDGLDDKLIIAQIKRHIKNLAADIDTIEGKIQDVYDTDEELHAEAVSLRSVPGIGPVTASIFIALLPELGRCSPKAIAALAGLAPYNADSGSTGQTQNQGWKATCAESLLYGCNRCHPNQIRVCQLLQKTHRSRKTPKSCDHRRRQKNTHNRKRHRQGQTNLCKIKHSCRFSSG
jgi:transposase